MLVQYNGEHQIYFGEFGSKRGNETVEPLYQSSWIDFHMMPTSRPVISPPSLKTNSVEIVGANGVIDLTEVPRGFPTYGNRTGSLDFYIDHTTKWGAMRVYDYDWTVAYSELLRWFHGRKMKMILSDDLAHYYYGRFTVTGWKSDKSMSTVSIGYDVDPYAYEVASAWDDAYWDPVTFSWIPNDGPETHFEYELTPWSEGNEWSFRGYELGIMPIVPRFNYTGINEELYLQVYSTYNGKTTDAVKLESNFAECFDAQLATPTFNDEVTLKFFVKDPSTGQLTPATTGTVQLDFRRGRL